MNISIKQLRAFLRVAEFGSFTKAGENLHVTQAGLSAMIRELETQLRCRLFDRTTRTVELTEAGSNLLPYVQRAVESVDGAIVQLGLVKHRTQARLRIGITPLVASSVLPAVIQEFTRLMPHMSVDAVDAERDVIQRLVENGELDAAYGLFFNRVSGLKMKRLFPTRLVLICPREQWRKCLRIGSGEDWALLDGAPLIVLQRADPFQRVVNQYLAATDAPSMDRREVRQLATAIGLVHQGIGVSLVPEFTLPACTRFDIREIPLTIRWPVPDFFCIVKTGRGEINGLDTFSKVLASQFSERTTRMRKN
jgi:DNA-binding transcriptional LysR family regulator